MEERREVNYSHILKYTSLFGGIQGIVILIGLIRNKAMALLLTADGMGFNALLSSMQNFAVQCTNLGISFSAIPRLSELYEQDNPSQLGYYIQVIRLWSLIAAALGLVFCVVVSPLVNQMTFSWGDHTLHYAMLGLAVAAVAIAGGETAILKATRRLGAIGSAQIFTAAGSVVISIPIYYYWRHSGVVPVIVLVATLNMMVSVFYSFRCYPYQLRFEWRMVKDGAGMLKLGLAFVLAAAIGSGAELMVRSFLNVEGGMGDVGLYNAGYMITVTYAGMVFTAMETDYFPRLSAVNKDITATNETVNKQMEVSLLFLSPMLVALLTMLPLLIPMLFTHEFMPVVAMAQLAVLSMYFKVLTLPVAYITLARGYSMSFLVLETAYFIVFVIAVALGYTRWGIYGTGGAIVLAHVFDYLMINAYAYWKYGYRCTWQIMHYAGVQLTLGALAFSASVLFEGWAYWTTEAALTFVSTAYSLWVLRQKTRLWESLKRKLLRT